MSKKLVFDASVHLGQFCIDDEKIRIACKNSQASLRGKKQTADANAVEGFCTFEENTHTDDIIWGLKREEQDNFYPFMDIFHSVKHAERISINASEDDVPLAQKLKSVLKISLSNALSCAVAARLGAVLHTCYPELLRPEVVEYMKKEHGVTVMMPDASKEMHFAEEDGGKKLEDAYVTALGLLKERNINLFQKALA